jgi:hypothetical protein
VGPMSGLCQVIIKNTNAFKESALSASINRSQSLLTTNRIPVLAPSRAERIRLETLLADVWTREVIPFPGMTGRARSEHLVRASASSMMRKLSVASIASNFTKRSASMASLHITAEDDESIHTKLPRAAGGYDHRSSETSTLAEVDESIKVRLSIIQDDKESMLQNESADNLSALAVGSPGSPPGTMRRFATLKGKKSWAYDGQRIITPPLRTSSANSVNQKRATSLSIVTDVQFEEKENLPQTKPAQPPPAVEKSEKKGRGIGMNRAVVAEGIRNFFR